MKSKPFGRGGPQVAAIGQGTWPLPDRDALRLGISLGMTHIDTAEMYGDGRSEEIVADAIEGVARERLFLVTKVLPEHADAADVRRACERSLTRLRTEYVDCYLVHWRGDVPLEETMGALAGLVESGHARSIGVSNFDTWDLREAASATHRARIACDQVLYNLDERSVEDHELPWAREYGCAIVAYTPLGRPTLDARKKKYAVVSEIARARRVPAQTIALAFLVRDPLAFAIPKASVPEHVEANARAGDIELTAAEIAAIDAAFPLRERRGALPTN